MKNSTPKRPDTATAGLRSAFQRPGSLAATLLLVGAAAGSALAFAPVASADTTAKAACTDAGGHAWKVSTVWSSKTYKEKDGSTRVINNNLSFTTAALDADTVDYRLTTYDGAGNVVSTKAVNDAAFNFAGGTKSLTLDPRNPPTAPGKSKIVLSVGDGNDHRANCSVTFIQPGGVTVTPTATPTVTPKPTPTPTPTPSSGFPDAANTGVPTGTQLSAYTGPSVIKTAGTVIDGKTINACIDIQANNVTIKNSKFTGDCFWQVLSDSGNTGLILTNVELTGGGDAGVGGENYTLTRANVHGSVDGLKAGSNVIIQDSYIHDLKVTSDSHNDGIQSLGTASLKILHNRIVLNDGANAAIILSTGSADAMRNVTISNNLMGGGGYTVFGGYQSGTDDKSKVSNISITNNSFTTVVFPKSGYYGPLTSTDAPVVVSGNTYYDGPNKGTTVS